MALLTLTTQIGGLAWLPAWWIGRRATRHRLGRAVVTLGLFAIGYLSLGLAAKAVAPELGREPLRCDGGGPSAAPRVAAGWLCVANRTYATPTLASVLADTALAMGAADHPVVLDAGFPFVDGFPLLPHLSHDDGRKVDLALHWTGPGGRRVPSPSPVGYWAFAEPRPGDPRPCEGRGDWLTGRWDMRWFQPLVREAVLDEAATAKLVRLLAADARVTKILLEPHLVERLGVGHPKVRFQGCRAARHDDHIHVEVAG